MTNPTPDIIGKARDLVANKTNTRAKKPGRFDKIHFAQALLEAVEAMEKLRSNPTMYIEEQQKILADALARIRSLPAE